MCQNKCVVSTITIDRNACEGKGPCVPACPHNVLVMDIIPKDERDQLTVMGKFKGFVHGWRQAFIAQKESCTACDLCVQSCPEKAIKLGRATANFGMRITTWKTT